MVEDDGELEKAKKEVESVALVLDSAVEGAELKGVEDETTDDELKSSMDDKLDETADKESVLMDSKD